MFCVFVFIKILLRILCRSFFLKIAIIKMFHKMEKLNREQIWNCYQYGRNFEQKVKEIKNQSRKRISVQIVRGKVYKKMKKQMIGNITKSAIRKRTQRAIKVYKLFTEIGREKILFPSFSQLLSK